METKKKTNIILAHYGNILNLLVLLLKERLHILVHLKKKNVTPTYKKLMKIKPVILCGGAGTRLWPKSKNNLPKQFIDFGGWTLFQKNSFEN